MKISEFILMTIARKCSIVSNDFLLSTPWWFRFELNSLTEDVDFGCRFGRNGVCEFRQIALKSENVTAKDKMCCCSGCSATIGHCAVFPGMGVKDEDLVPLEIIASHFDKDLGFWREKVGCILPRRYRSRTCLTYKCESLQNFYDKVVVEAIKDLDNFYVRYERHLKETLLRDDQKFAVKPSVKEYVQMVAERESACFLLDKTLEDIERTNA